MKHKILKRFRIFSIALILILFILIMWLFVCQARPFFYNRTATGNKTANGNGELVLQELFPGNNSGKMAVKNACGSYGDYIFSMIRERNYDKLADQLNEDILSKYNYTCCWDDFDRYFSILADTLPDDSEMMVYDITSSRLTDGAWIVAYDIAGRQQNSVDLAAYNYDNSISFTMTVYFDKTGRITSMLPCIEASIDSYAAMLGFVH